MSVSGSLSYVLAASLAAVLLPLGQAIAQSEEVDIEIEALPEVTSEPGPQGSPNPETPSSTETAELRATIELLEARLAAVEAREVVASPAAEPTPEDDVRPPWRRIPKWVDKLDLRVSGYIQAQAEFHQLSEDEISPDGAALNQDRFLIRRARLRAERFFKYAHVALEIDANTVRGPFVSVRRAEASFFLPNRQADLPPYVMITAGLSEIPFGYELTQGHAQRPFMERTAGSLAFFRGEPDVGVRLSGAVGPFRYAIAAQNGVPIDDRPGASSTVFNHQKTAVGRLGFEVARPEIYELSGGASFLAGTGFHAGTPETKSSLLWSDANQDGNVTLNELIASPGQAATPSATFSRWGVNADLELGFHSVIGWTRVYGEVTMASNLDRSYFVADPISTGYDLRELAWTAAFVQEITPYALLGLRADSYDPNSDLFDARRGQFIPTDASELTLSPVIGGQLPRLGRLLLQYDHIFDNLGRNTSGEPSDLPNDRWTLRLQVGF